MQTRRGFLGLLAAGLALDPERLLWRPGAKLISVPAPRLLPLHRKWIVDGTLNWESDELLVFLAGGDGHPPPDARPAYQRDIDWLRAYMRDGAVLG